MSSPRAKDGMLLTPKTTSIANMAYRSTVVVAVVVVVVLAGVTPPGTLVDSTGEEDSKAAISLHFSGVADTASSTLQASVAALSEAQ